MGQEKRTKYEIENIDNPCILTLAVNLKEYLELLKDRYLNKKHKGIKKGSSGLGFENFAQRIKSLVNFDTFEKPLNAQKQVSRLTLVTGEMVKKTVTKIKFSQLKDKKFYFPDGILLLPLGHPNLNDIDGFKKKRGQKIEKKNSGKRKNICSI